MFKSIWDIFNRIRSNKIRMALANVVQQSANLTKENSISFFLIFSIKSLIVSVSILLFFVQIIEFKNPFLQHRCLSLSIIFPHLIFSITPKPLVFLQKIHRCRTSTVMHPLKIQILCHLFFFKIVPFWIRQIQ